MRARILVFFAAALFLVSAAEAVDRSVSPIVSRIPRHRVESSALDAVGYSKRLRALEIEFHDGSIYRYLAVPQPVHQALLESGSKATYYNRHVRGKYRCVRVKPPRTR